VLVDADTGEVQVRHTLTEHVSNASYRVFTSDSPTPFSPGHATPSSVQPALVSRGLVTTPGLNLVASPNGWIDDGVFETRFRALTPCRFAVLDDRVRAVAATQPELASALVAGAVRRAGTLAGQVVLAQLVAIDDRLRILFPSLAERWGRVTAEGVVLPAFLSHTVLSALVGARRPSLTAAVGRLVHEGVVRRLPDRRWLLAPELAAVAA